MSGLPGLSYSDDIVPPSPKRMRLDERLGTLDEQDPNLEDEDFYDDGTPMKKQSSENLFYFEASRNDIQEDNNHLPPGLLSEKPASTSVELTSTNVQIQDPIDESKTQPPRDEDVDQIGTEVDDFYEPAGIEPTNKLALPVSQNSIIDSPIISEGSSLAQSKQEEPQSTNDLIGANSEVGKDGEKRTQALANGNDGQTLGKDEGKASEAKTSSANVIDDAEFLAVAQANKEDVKAEWRFDSSDAESSDSSDTSSSDDSSSEGDSDDDAELLDAATQARLLLEAIGDEDEPAPSGPLRTVNEKAEEILPKPDLKLTPDMKITELGHVENIVGNFLVIKGTTTGTYQVVEAGSALCTEDRTVIGAVMEPMARVQQPMYSMGFKDIKEMEDAGVGKGTKVFYVDVHSTFVFTQPLKEQKGTDASNLHDEEIGREEIEFSDDEKEQAYKQERKKGKRGRGNDQRGGRGHDRSDQSRPTKPGHPDDMSSGPRRELIRYDDDEEDEIYRPLKRPDNFSHAQSPPISNGRGRGGRDFGDRGRGGRGRGRGSDRGGRGGAFNERSNGRGGSRGGHRVDQSYSPDHRNNFQPSSHGQGRSTSQDWQRTTHDNSRPGSSRSDFAPAGHQQYAAPKDSQPQYAGYPIQNPSALPPPPASFNPMALLNMLPAGAHLNPALLAQSLMQMPNMYPQGQQQPMPPAPPPQDPRLHPAGHQQQHWQQPYQPAYPPQGYNQQHDQHPVAYGQQAVQQGTDQSGSLQAQANLAAILRNLSGANQG